MLRINTKQAKSQDEQIRDFLSRSISKCFQSTSRLRKKLIAKKFNTEAIEKILEEFTQAGYINDEYFASELAKSLSKEKLFVGSRLVLELAKKDISSQLANQTILDLDLDLEKISLELAKRLVDTFAVQSVISNYKNEQNEQYNKDYKKMKKSIINKIVQSGFSYSQATNVLNCVLAD